MTRRWRWQCGICSAWGYVGEPVDGQPSPEQTAAAHEQAYRAVMAHHAARHRGKGEEPA
ncbi:MAG TPA: hypothetical protein VKY81_05985 [Natronosporangium sp.]|nr:hypothetical protein [Natronosporangium sp.]